MKNKPLLAAIAAAACCTPLVRGVTVDGLRDATGYTERAVQTITAGWGAGNVLANLHTAQDGGNLAVFIGGRANDPGAGNAILLFVDCKPGGVGFIANNTITSGGEHETINNLGSSTSAGMGFETGFTADYAVRIYGKNGEAHVNRYDLQAGTRAYVGDSGGGAPVAGGFVTSMQTAWEDVSGPYGGVVKGVEMKLGLAAMGVPAGSGQPIRLLAVLVNNNSSWGSNQTLASKSGTGDLAGGINAFDFQAEAGDQTVSFTVDNTDTDGDGISDATDPDDDNDGLTDAVETGTGSFVDAGDTGTNPLVADTDGDGYDDGAETNGTAGSFGFVTDPTRGTNASMAAPGSYTNPAWQVSGAGGGAMTRLGSDLADQNKWKLDFRFTTTGGIEYKFAANGSWTRSWGDNGGNFTYQVQASGFHTVEFNDFTLARFLARTVFDTEAEYLAAYALAGGSAGNDDGDALTNAQEFALNTDPTHADSDRDGINDDADPDPLVASPRTVVFRVNMAVQQTLGLFDPNADTVVVDFFDGLAGSQPDLALSDPDLDGIWTGEVALAGPVGASGGGYKFRTNHPGAPASGYEGAISNRTLTLAAGTLQTLAVVYFNNLTPYQGWAQLYAGGQGINGDHDGDGTPNGVEHFMGQTGSSFTIVPQPVNRVVTWTRNPNAVDMAFKVWTSTDLANWTDVTGSATVSPTAVSYQLPPDAGAIFVRLGVNAN